MPEPPRDEEPRPLSDLMERTRDLLRRTQEMLDTSRRQLDHLRRRTPADPAPDEPDADE